MNARNEAEETVRLMRQIAAHRERAERYELAWTSARRRALGRREVIRRLRGQLAEVHATSAKERQQLDEARARANEAARLSAEARDRADGQGKVIADLREQIAIQDENHLRLLAERDEARTEVVTTGLTLALKQAAVRRLAQSLAEATQEVNCWRAAFGETALKDATDRLRAALDEERIEPRPSEHGTFTKSYAIDQITEIDRLRAVAHRMWEAFAACHEQSAHIIGALVGDGGCSTCATALLEEGEPCDRYAEWQKKISDGFGMV